MKIDVDRMGHGAHEEWYLHRSTGIKHIVEEWGSEIPPIFCFKSKTEEVMVICRSQRYGGDLPKLTRFKYKERGR